MSNLKKILVVDDEKKMRRLMEMMLKDEGYDAILASHGEEAISKIKHDFPDLIITDMKMPGISSIELIKKFKIINNSIPIIIMTAYGTIQTAVEAMKQGVSDYILKPFDMENMKLTISKTLKLDQIIQENKYLREELADRYKYQNIIGESAKIKETFKMIEQVAKTKSTVLLSGESGTGKELTAQAIHFQSPRKDKPFVIVNCAALPETLLESELFGYKKGAFTGAYADKDGKFKKAEEGTIFLDEITCLPFAVQAKLLRVIQEREFEPIGSTKIIKTDVRIIAATNKNIEEAVKNGILRDDLYYRLNVFPIKHPSLRERRGDIPLLAAHFLKLFNKELKKNIEDISQEALNILESYRWPGNIRELENIIQRAVVICNENIIKPEHFPFPLTQTSPSDISKKDLNKIPYKEAKNKILESFDKEYITALLKETKGNISKSAQIANIDRKNFYKKLNELGIETKDFK
jgi:DNA-binding NtrC family response regulator